MAKRGRPAKKITFELNINETLVLTRKQLDKLQRKNLDIPQLCKTALMKKLRGPSPKTSAIAC